MKRRTNEILAGYGLTLKEVAVLEYFHRWSVHNRKAHKNERDGRFWVFNSVAKIAADFGGLISARTIFRATKKLETEGLLVSGNFNRMRYDRTKWYALTDTAWTIIEHPEKAAEAEAEAEAEAAPEVDPAEMEFPKERAAELAALTEKTAEQRERLEALKLQVTDLKAEPPLPDFEATHKEADDMARRLERGMELLWQDAERIGLRKPQQQQQQSGTPKTRLPYEFDIPFRKQVGRFFRERPYLPPDEFIAFCSNRAKTAMVPKTIFAGLIVDPLVAADFMAQKANEAAGRARYEREVMPPKEEPPQWAEGAGDVLFDKIYAKIGGRR